MTGTINYTKGAILPIALQKHFDWGKGLLDWVVVWWVGWQKKWVCILWDEKSEKNPGIPKETHTCSIFHKLVDFFGMVDMTVVKHKHTMWSRVWVGEWQLRFHQILSKSPEYSHAPQAHAGTLQITHSSLTLQSCHAQWYHPRWWLARLRTSSP